MEALVGKNGGTSDARGEDRPDDNDDEDYDEDDPNDRRTPKVKLMDSRNSAHGYYHDDGNDDGMVEPYYEDEDDYDDREDFSDYARCIVRDTCNFSKVRQ